ncbi:ParA family protein [Listeria seeligeri]|uniref:ParA family protein n=1 Tax=Listeria seeligeri TaxID=1640 RepID=UPI0010B67DC6|nr:ParA family protein [Listeria seeligeri]EAC2922396.1 hypothetical protein [Listeria monocytogenes]MBC1557000.1 AAA family ATPase [Listeria seeligeri]HAB0718280.1 hypothetical protein [Listeria monocytogenes]
MSTTQELELFQKLIYKFEKAQVISFTVRKGGVGKTCTSVPFAVYLASAFEEFKSSIGKHKILFIDLDGQGDATTMLTRTFKYKGDDYTSYLPGVIEKNLKPYIIPMSDTLDLLPAGRDLRDFEPYLYDNYTKDTRSFVLDALLEPLRTEYDYIIIDTQPSEGLVNNNAVYASDFIVMPMQTKEYALSGVLKFLEELDENEAAAAEILAVVPQIVKVKATAEKQIMGDAQELLGSLLTNNLIYDRDRVEGWALTGISYNEATFAGDHHNKRTWEMYRAVCEELIERLVDYGI